MISNWLICNINKTKKPQTLATGVKALVNPVFIIAQSKFYMRNLVEQQFQLQTAVSRERKECYQPTGSYL